MLSNFYTYFHTRNDSGAVFYVGKGMGKRAHSTARNEHWHRVVAKCGHTVHMAMSNLSEDNAFSHEKLLIQCFKDMGIPLCNQTDGGEGTSGHIHNEETKKKMSVKIKQAKANPLVFKKQSDANVLSWANPEIRQKRLSGMRQSSSSLKTRAKLSILAKKSWSNPKIKHERTLKIVEAILKNPKIKVVLCIEDNRVFRTTGEAQKWLRESGKLKAMGSNVLSVCNGQLKSAYGYTWRYA